VTVLPRSTAAFSKVAVALSSQGARQVRYVFLLRMIGFVLATASSVIVARVLGPEQRGVFAAALVLPGMMATFLNFGLPVSNVYYLNRSRPPGVLFFNGAIFCAVVSLLGMAVCGAGWTLGFCAKYFEGVDNPLIVVLALSTTVLLIFEVFLGQFLRGLQSFYIPVLRRIYYDLIRLAAILALFWLLDVTVGALIVVSFATLLLMDLFLLRAVVHRVTIRGARPSFSQFRESISYGLKHFLGTLLNTLNTKIDLLVLALFLERRTLGIYAVAVGISGLSNFLPWAIGHVSYPRLAKQDDNEKRREIIRKCVTYNLLVLIPAWLAFLAVGRWLVVLMYGKEYQDSYLLASILTAGIILLSVTQLLNKYFSGSGRPGLISVARVVNLPVKAASLYLLCRYYGVLGASSSFVLSNVTLLLATFAMYKAIVRMDVEKDHVQPFPGGDL